MGKRGPERGEYNKVRQLSVRMHSDVYEQFHELCHQAYKSMADVSYQLILELLKNPEMQAKFMRRTA